MKVDVDTNVLVSGFLIGTWHLVEFWGRDAIAAPKLYAYGERPAGY